MLQTLDLTTLSAYFYKESLYISVLTDPITHGQHCHLHAEHQRHVQYCHHLHAQHQHCVLVAHLKNTTDSGISLQVYHMNFSTAKVLAQKLSSSKYFIDFHSCSSHVTQQQGLQILTKSFTVETRTAVIAEYNSHFTPPG